MRDTRYQWSYIFGAVCRECAVAAGLVLPFANTAAMTAQFAEIARTVAPGAHAVLRRENDPPHPRRGRMAQCQGTHHPGQYSAPALAPYAPELNPGENVGADLRANQRAITVFDTCDDIVDACCTAGNVFTNDPETIASITSRDWAEVSR